MREYHYFYFYRRISFCCIAYAVEFCFHRTRGTRRIPIGSKSWSRGQYVTRFFLSGERFSGATVDFLLYIEAMRFRNFVNDQIASDRLANR